MLTKEEESRLVGIQRTIQAAKEQQKMPMIGAYDMEWLAEKLKETNDELKELNRSVEHMRNRYSKEEDISDVD